MKQYRCHMGRGTETENDNFENRSGASTRNKCFDPARYGMVVCLDCKGDGYVHNPKRQCCPKCGGFGFIKKVLEKHSDKPTRIS